MDSGSVVLVTGGNSGIGKVTCIEIAKLGAQVIMLCRNKVRGEEALAEVRRLSENKSVDLMICDLSSIRSIEDFCIEFRKRYDKLHVIINNAGVIVPGRHETLDGYELQFGVNHLGHFLLTNRLLNLLEDSAPSRIVNVTSGAHKIGKIFFNDLNLKSNYTLWRAYAQSKLANILFTYELADRLKDKKVAVNCVYPGAVATNMGINRDTGFGTLITRMLKPFFQTPLEGAETIIYLAASKETEGISGKYFYRKKAIYSSKLSYNKEIAKKLWNISESMVGLKDI